MAHIANYIGHLFQGKRSRRSGRIVCMEISLAVALISATTGSAQLSRLTISILLL